MCNSATVQLCSLLEMRETKKRKAGIGKRVERRASISMLSTTTTTTLRQTDALLLRLLLLQFPLLLMLLPLPRQSPAFPVLVMAFKRGAFCLADKGLAQSDILSFSLSLSITHCHSQHSHHSHHSPRRHPHWHHRHKSKSETDATATLHTAQHSDSAHIRSDYCTVYSTSLHFNLHLTLQFRSAHHH